MDESASKILEIPSGSPLSGSVPPSRSGSRPRTAARFRAHNQSRLNTAVTTTSSVGELPEHSFFPDNDDDEYGDEDDGLYSEDEDGDVFAFERPKTAAVPAGTHENPQMLAQSAMSGSISGRKAATPDASRSVTFGFNVDDRHDISASGTLSPELDVLTHLPYGDDTNRALGQGHNLNASAYTSQADLWATQRPSVVSSTLIGRPSTSRTKNSQRLSALSRTPADTTSDFGFPDAAYRNKMNQSNQSDGIELSAYASTDAGDTRQGRPETRGTRGSWIVSELHGATTIPDGVTTKGDGLGGLHPKWAADDAYSSMGGGAEAPEEDSPYPEVRASVSNIDDPDMPGRSAFTHLVSDLTDPFHTNAAVIHSPHYSFGDDRAAVCYGWFRFQYFLYVPWTRSCFPAFGRSVSHDVG